MRDVELHGEKLREGETVLFLYASANRDEREFPDPDRFDIARRPPRILSFGHGTHACLGIHIAKAEGRIALEELLRALARIRGRPRRRRAAAHRVRAGLRAPAGAPR